MRIGMVLTSYKNSPFNKLKIFLGLLVFGLVFGVFQTLYSQETGYKYFKNYTYRAYDHQAQNWGMVQAKNGLIYVANQGGVLEFDGVSWRVIGVPNYDTVRSIAIDKSGTVFIGGNNKIGYLSPDSKGTLKCKSLLNHVENNKKNFSDVWATHAGKEGIYFRTTKYLFRWDYKDIKVWSTPNAFKTSFVCNEHFILQQQAVGLVQVVNDSLHLIPGGETFAEEKIWMMVPYDIQRNSQVLLIGTRSKGFYLYDGKALVPFPTEADGYLEKNKSYQGIRLSSGDFALATLRGGLVIIDHQGRLKHIMDKTSGLQDEKVHSVFEDFQGNIWLCLDNGISKIEYTSPFYFYDNRCGLSGLVLSVIRHKENIYAGTSQGLYVLRAHEKIFQPLVGISGSCWRLVSIAGSVLAATEEGVFQVDDQKDTRRKVVKDPAYTLLVSPKYPGLTWCGTDNGLIALSSKKNQWTENYRFETIKEKIRYISEDNNGSLWLVTSAGGVLKVNFPSGFNKPGVTWYETSHGLPGGRVYPAMAVGHIMFATQRGIFRFDEKNNIFIPDRTMGDEFAGGPGSKDIFRIAEDKKGNIWFNSRSKNFQAVLGTGGSFTIKSQPFGRIPEIQVNDIYPDPDGKTTWFASYDGLIRYDAAGEKNYRQNFNVLFRKITVNGNLLFAGGSAAVGSAAPNPITEIKYKDRKNFHFEVAAAFFEAETKTRYRYLLEGHDDEWSGWSSETAKNFTTLDSGMYKFRVQAKNVYGQPGSEAIFPFRILPPWYWTWWAFLFYGMGILLLMFLAVKWRSHKLEQEKQKLEYIIIERTKEIQEKNRQLKDQSDKLKEMDIVKSRFFANISHEFRTPLTLIMGPMERMLSDTRDKKQRKELSLMLRNSQQLLTLINQLLDLSRFDSSKMTLQAGLRDIVPFLKGILSAFHLLAQQNQLELEFHSQQEGINLYFDAQKMEAVMMNLLVNAIKFTPAGGKITVSIMVINQTEEESFSRGFVEISVSDTGIGIPKEELPNIFDRFYQAKGLKQGALKGTGIGLSLIKENVLLHRGKIDVHSQEGKGTEFVIRLPMGQEHLKPGEITDISAAPPPQRKYKEIESLYIATETTNEAENESEKGELESPEQEKPVILVVEDHAEVRKYICDPLKQRYTVVEAADGREGIEKAKNIIPDLIVSDIMMPEVDGNELCRVLKKDIKTSHIPIILLTAKASEESIIQGLETGADDYITKPFNTRILMTRIKNLVNLRRQLQQKIQKQMLLQPTEISVSSMDREFIKSLQEIIEKNLSDPEFHVEALCQKLYMNRVTLFRKVKALTGESPTEFIRSYRLKRAAQLLRDNFGNVSEVALEVGFSNLGYFTRCFKNKFYQLPSTYQAS